MTATTITIAALTVSLILLGLSAIGNAIRIRKMQTDLDHERAVAASWEELATQRSNHAQNFLNAARIIAIDRNGRLLNFTIARGETFFQIETMALLSDDVTSWRKQCGLNAE